MCLFEWPATSIVVSVAGCHGWAPPNSDSLYGGDGSVCARVYARAGECACVCACVMCL